jgi:hypothetical protein
VTTTDNEGGMISAVHTALLAIDHIGLGAIMASMRCDHGRTSTPPRKPTRGRWLTQQRQARQWKGKR